MGVGRIHRSDSQTPLFTKPPGGALETISDFFKDLFYPGASGKEDQDRLVAEWKLLTAAKSWQVHQAERSVASPIQKVEPSNDEIETFFREFLYNIVTQYFNVSLLEKIKKAISEGASDIVRDHADLIAQCLLAEESDFNLALPLHRNLINQSFEYLFKCCATPEEKSEILVRALEEWKKPYHHAIPLAEKCTVDALYLIFKEDPKPFIKILGRMLLSKLLSSDSFIQSVSRAVLETLKPLMVDGTSSIKEITEVSSIIKVLARLTSLLASKRITHLMRTFDIKWALDEAIAKALGHVQGHSDAVKWRDQLKTRLDPDHDYLIAFAAQKGCHPICKMLIYYAKQDKSDRLQAYLEDFSRVVIDFVFDTKTVEAFVSNLPLYEEDLIAGNKDNPIILPVVKALCNPANSGIIKNSIDGLKPLAVSGLAKLFALLGFQKIFPNNLIYRPIYHTIAPPIFDLIRKGIVTKIFGRYLKEFVPYFLELWEKDLKSANLAQIITSVKRHYNNCFNSDLPEEYLKLIPMGIGDAFSHLKRIGWMPGMGDSMETELKRYYTAEFNSDGSQVYGQLLVEVIFGLSPRGIIWFFSWLRDNKGLEDGLRDVFLDGVCYMRGVGRGGEKLVGVDPNQFFFDLIKDSLLPYRDENNVKELLETEIKPLSEKTIDAETRINSEILAKLLFDLIQISIPPGGQTPFNIAGRRVDLDGHLVYALKVLFSKTVVNYNLLLWMIDIFKTLIQKVHAAEKSNEQNSP